MKNLIKTYDDFINDTYTQETAFTSIENILKINNYNIEYNNYDYMEEGRCLCLNVYKNNCDSYEDRIYYNENEDKEIFNFLKLKLYIRLVKSDLFKGLFKNANV